ncbi:7403_t:CDS:2 [Funneliformis geosporum]|nr:7403_t:CDS:2 [Funneliformis geosporum]
MPKKQGKKQAKHKENKPIKKVAWSKEDEEHRKKLIECAERYAKAQQEVLSIPGTSVIEDIQYAMSLQYEEYKANTCPDRFEHKYDLSLAESPTKIMEEYSDLTTVLHRDLNYDIYWAVNETGEILDKAIGYDNHLEEEESDSVECLYTKKVYGAYTSSPVPPQPEYNNIRMLKEVQILFFNF